MNLDQINQALQSISQGEQAVAKAIRETFPQQTGTSGTATGGAATLPGNPVGFLTVTLPNGSAVKVPYYS